MSHFVTSSKYLFYYLISDWISPDVTDCTLATCKYCRISLKAHKKALLKHALTEKPKKAIALDKSAKSCKLLPMVYKPVLSDKTKTAEIKIAAFIAEHTSVMTVDHLIELLPQLDPSSDALKNLRLHRTKCSMIIKNVLGPTLLSDLIEEIGESPYSIIIDESTDLSTQKVLCIMVRFYSNKNNDIVTTFYRLIKLRECDAKTVYDAIKDQLTRDGLKIENMVGIGVDGANVMVGKHNSVTALLKSELPDIVIVKCVSHSLHLCAENAAKLLPRQLEFLVREAHNWFSYSPKRLEKYRDLFEAMNDSRSPKKIQGLSGTRWLER
ncbi:uncharacterized protein LOC111362226 [Spodoptera litura]|uniref:Uncharacterized protein LOC111362226 n=1 Tax=Spodoptera litura TaxID=69820 RepID=A0A9J7J4D9_SPOLT|nr:uncharacterized protein LOC111362226 [Spodoptera litura]